MQGEPSSALRQALLRLCAMDAQDREGVLAELDPGAQQQVRDMLMPLMANKAGEGNALVSALAPHGLSNWLLERIQPDVAAAHSMTLHSKTSLEECARRFLSSRALGEGQGKSAQTGVRSLLNRKGGL